MADLQHGNLVIVKVYKCIYIYVYICIFMYVYCIQMCGPFGKMNPLFRIMRMYALKNSISHPWWHVHEVDSRERVVM